MEPTKIVKGPIKRRNAESGRFANYYLCDDGKWYNHKDFAQMWRLNNEICAAGRIRRYGHGHPLLFTKGPIDKYGKRRSDHGEKNSKRTEKDISKKLGELTPRPFDLLMQSKSTVKRSRKKVRYFSNTEQRVRASNLKYTEMLKEFNKKMVKKGLLHEGTFVNPIRG